MFFARYLSLIKISVETINVQGVLDIIREFNFDGKSFFSSMSSIDDWDNIADKIACRNVASIRWTISIRLRLHSAFWFNILACSVNFIGHIAFLSTCELAPNLSHHKLVMTIPDFPVYWRGHHLRPAVRSSHAQSQAHRPYTFETAPYTKISFFFNTGSGNILVAVLNFTINSAPLEMLLSPFFFDTNLVSVQMLYNFHIISNDCKCGSLHPFHVYIMGLLLSVRFRLFFLYQATFHGYHPQINASNIYSGAVHTAATPADWNTARKESQNNFFETSFWGRASVVALSTSEVRRRADFQIFNDERSALLIC